MYEPMNVSEQIEFEGEMVMPYASFQGEGMQLHIVEDDGKMIFLNAQAKPVSVLPVEVFLALSTILEQDIQNVAPSLAEGNEDMDMRDIVIEILQMAMDQEPENAAPGPAGSELTGSAELENEVSKNGQAKQPQSLEGDEAVEKIEEIIETKVGEAIENQVKPQIEKAMEQIKNEMSTEPIGGGSNLGL